MKRPKAETTGDLVDLIALGMWPLGAIEVVGWQYDYALTALKDSERDAPADDAERVTRARVLLVAAHERYLEAVGETDETTRPRRARTREAQERANARRQQRRAEARSRSVAA